LARPKPNQDQFTLQPNFSNHILDAFVTIPHQDCSKTMTHLFTNFATKALKANPPNLPKQKTQQRTIPFATKLLTPHFANICDKSPPRLLKNHDFTFSPILLPTHKN